MAQNYIYNFFDKNTTSYQQNLILDNGVNYDDNYDYFYNYNKNEDCNENYSDKYNNFYNYNKDCDENLGSFYNNQDSDDNYNNSYNYRDNKDYNKDCNENYNEDYNNLCNYNNKSYSYNGDYNRDYNGNYDETYDENYNVLYNKDKNYKNNQDFNENYDDNCDDNCYENYKNNKENYTLVSLPYEILSLIYDEHLSIGELLKLRYMDRELSEAINTEEFWKIMLERDFPNTIGVDDQIDVGEISKENVSLIRYIDEILNMSSRSKYIFKYLLYKRIEKVLDRDQENTFTLNVYRAIELNNGIDRRLIKQKKHKIWNKEINIFDILPYITANELSYNFTENFVNIAYNTFWNIAENKDTQKLLLSLNNEILTGVGLIGLQIYVYIWDFVSESEINYSLSNPDFFSNIIKLGKQKFETISNSFTGIEHDIFKILSILQSENLDCTREGSDFYKILLNTLRLKNIKPLDFHDKSLLYYLNIVSNKRFDNYFS